MPALSRADLQSIVTSIWQSFLGVEVEALESRRADERMDPAKTLGARVFLRGTWTGSVSLTCEATLARRIAAVMLAVDASEVGPVAVSDALGELANVLGGNVKNLLPPSCVISLPVTHEPGFVDPPAVDTIAAAFECFGEVFVVRVVEGARARGPSLFPRAPNS